MSHPAITTDKDGNLHIDCLAVLRAVGLPDTPENHQKIIRAIAEILKENGGDPSQIRKGTPHPSVN